MHKENIAAMRQYCLDLPGGEILDRYTDELAAAICNGVGAAWADRVAPHASAILNRALPWAVCPAVLHDLRYHEGVGGGVGRAAADYQFWAGCCQCIEDSGGNFLMRWWRRRKAWALYILLRKYGNLAWEGKNE